jgi:hypothetical protein
MAEALQELMRQGSVITTMYVYGRAMPGIKREANSKAVSMVLKKEKKGAGQSRSPSSLLLMGVYGGLSLIPQFP